MTRLGDDVVGHLRDVAGRPDLPDRYVISRQIGRGGMGVVYAAHDSRLDRDVAIKVSTAPVSRRVLDARLEQEARVLARLEHPGVVPVHDAGLLADGRAFYVMKLIRGDTLARHAIGLGGEAAILGLFERVAETIAFAHSAGVVHRDLTPANIMVGSFGEVLVLDWGVAKIIDRGGGASSSLPPPDAIGSQDRGHAGGTAGGTRIGTPGFMAPEQQRGDSALAGPESDVYSLGALLFWMLTGALPAAADANPPTAGTGGMRLPRRLRAILRKSLSADRAARYQDAGALVADLSRYRSGHSVLAHRETPLERAGRWFLRYRTFILMVAAYLIMRALFAFFG